MLPPVTLPVATTKPAVPMLPTLALPVTVKLVSDPTDVMLGCAAVVSVPVKKLAVTTLPPLMLTGTANTPVVLLNVNPALPVNTLLSLNCTVVFDPPAAAEPEPPTDAIALPLPEYVVYPVVSTGVVKPESEYNANVLDVSTST